MTADSIEACNCDHGCNCQFAGYPNDGFCEFLIGVLLVGWGAWLLIGAGA